MSTPLGPNAPEPAAGSTVRDKDRQIWRSWEDGLGRRWWGLAHNEDADPLAWPDLESGYAPLFLLNAA